MSYLFFAKTDQAFVFRNLTDVLYSNLARISFIVDEKGMKMRQMNQRCKVMFDIDLNAYDFTYYKFESDKPINLGIEISYLYKILNSVKKKDTIELFIEKDRPDDLGIRLYHKSGFRVTTSFIKIQNFQNLDIYIEDNY